MPRPNLNSRVVGEPAPGFFKIKLVTGGPWVPAKIELIDGKWVATINDKEQSPRNADPIVAAGVMRIWESGYTIQEHDYEYMVVNLRYAQANDPDLPAANPNKRINLLTMRPVFKVDEEV